MWTKRGGWLHGIVTLVHVADPIYGIKAWFDDDDMHALRAFLIFIEVMEVKIDTKGCEEWLVLRI